MKLSYPIAAPDSLAQVQAFCGEYETAFEWISAQGYAGVELLVRDPQSFSVERADSLLKKWNLKVAAIGTSPMQIQDHLFLLHPDEENRAEAMARCRSLIELASYYQVPALIGKYRGQIGDAPGCRKEDQLLLFQEICDLGRKAGIRILVEPQNQTSLNNLNTIRETLEWIERIGEDNLGILADIYHMGITETSIEESLLAAKSQIGLIHMADSDRMVPGLGNLPVRRILQILEEMAYEGFISIEIRQWPDSRTAAALSAYNLRYLAGWQ
ncbi:MAG: sugar phosphate isomerase/epimerase [Clostridiales bacterium]|nr:sugar phosphate isomerase/epimerase [Clostridiales bacterium]